MSEEQGLPDSSPIPFAAGEWIAGQEAPEEEPAPGKGCLSPLRLLALLLLMSFLALSLSDLLQHPDRSWLIWRQPALPLSRETLVRRQQQPVTLLLARQRLPGRLGRGTGFNVHESGVVVSSRHLLDDALEVLVLFPDGRRFRSRNWLTSQTDDMAVILLEGSELPVAEMAAELPAVGSSLLLIGYAEKEDEPGLEARLDGYAEGLSAKLMLLDVNLRPGHSGSPVFQADGRVVGFVFAAMAGPSEAGGMGLALAAPSLAAFLARSVPQYFAD